MQFIRIYTIFHRIGGVMVSLLTPSVVDRGFYPWPGETKDYKTCCFTAKHVPLKCNNKYGFGQNQDNESEWGDMSYSGQLFQRASTITTKLSALIWYKANISTISSTLPSSCHDIYKNNCFDLIWFLVFNATFSNISAISWRPVLVVEEAGVPGENHRPWTSNWLTLSFAVASRVHPFL